MHIGKDANVCVCLTFDGNFVQHAGACIQSIIDNYKSSRVLDVYLIVDCVSEFHLGLFKKQVQSHGNANLHIIPFSGEVHSVSPQRSLPRSAFMRLQIPNIIPHAKYLYIDTDTIVLSDVSELFDADLAGRTVGAVKDSLFSSMVCQDVNISRALSGRYGMTYRDYYTTYLGGKIEHSEDYINSGVMVVDSRRWIQGGMDARIREFCSDRPDGFIFADQDIINSCLSGDISHLDEMWNTCKWAIGDAGFDTRTTGILHFAGNRKPWDGSIESGAYWYYLSRSPFFYISLERLALKLYASEQAARGRSKGVLSRIGAGIRTLGRRLRRSVARGA